MLDLLKCIVILFSSTFSPSPANYGSQNFCACTKHPRLKTKTAYPNQPKYVGHPMKLDKKPWRHLKSWLPHVTQSIPNMTSPKLTTHDNSYLSWPTPLLRLDWVGWGWMTRETRRRWLFGCCSIPSTRVSSRWMWCMCMNVYAYVCSCAC